MTDAELAVLRAEYTQEYQAMLNWLENGQAYAGTKLTELTGKAAPQAAARPALRDLIKPSLLWLRFEQQVLGQHADYPDYQVLDSAGVILGMRSALLTSEISTQQASLNALVGV